MRKKVFTHFGFQFLFIGSFLAGIGLILFSIIGLNLLTAAVLRRNPALSVDQVSAVSAWPQEWLPGVLAVSFALLFIASVVSMLLSARYIGPLLRIEQWLENILIGNKPPPLTVRPGDETAKIVHLLNRIVPKITK